MTTLLESLRDSLRQTARFNPDDAVQPAAVLWADQDRQWQSLINPLRRLMPELFSLGEYAPEQGTGPVIWLRCATEGVLPEIDFPKETIPIVYLPGVSRQDLRAGQECPEDLKPLVELQYRGACWTQRNGKDWTIEAFLVSNEGGLGLDVRFDAATRRALAAALPELALTPIGKLKGKRLEAEDFDRLLTEDTTKDLLIWLSDARRTQSEWTEAKWGAFRSRCRSEYKFDPEKDGELAAAELLAHREGNWAAAWERFAESPSLYPGLPLLLKRVSPEDMFSEPSVWPQRNEQLEVQLRTALLGLEKLDPARAQEAVRKLEDEHGPRREWVWAKLGQTPLAASLQHLAKLAERTRSGIGGTTREDFANTYVSGAFEADLAALDALAAVRSVADVEAVSAAVRSLYLPWLERTARDFQEVLKKQGVLEDPEAVSTGAGSVLFFVDGLRYDVATRLAERMRVKHWDVSLGRRWAGIPTVTASSKPLVSPIAGFLTGTKLEGDFLPTIAASKADLTADRFRKLLDSEGYQYIPVNEMGNPAGRGWTEVGDLDHLGHTLQGKLAAHIEEQLDLVVERIQMLFDAGWQEVRIVTDHGWLLMPGGLPKVDLPKYLTLGKWARCAAVKGESVVDVPVFGWNWNPNERVAVAPGASVFSEGNDYAHGGVSIQECLIPDIRVTVGSAVTDASLAIEEVKWLGLRCQARVSRVQPGVMVDIRTRINDAQSSVVEPRTPSEEGIVRLLVTDDSLEGASAVVVAVDSGGHVLSKAPTIIGGDGT